MRADRSSQYGNNILTALSPREAAQLHASCRTLELSYGDVLFDAGDRLRHVYFPTSGLVSLLTHISDGSSAEVGLVGVDGVAGVSTALGVPLSPVQALVQGSGYALQMKVGLFRAAVRQSPRLQREINRYLYCLMAQMMQTAACNRFHLVAERLARWLLMAHDRLHSDSFYLTQNFLAHMLSVRRVGVTAAARALRGKKLISYSRGTIIILNRAGLERASCECYGAVNAICERAALV